ncbi:MAG TPA: esterase-like activity of phytase family protein [Sphingomonas sp.]|jgi:hypothetical protein|nr:esterase-like activity of phytase family protein [Sphingomonas sp.]
MRLGRLLLVTSALLTAGSAQAAIQFVGKYEVAADTIDLSGESASGAQNRLSFGSDWVFGNGKFYGITDRGPGGGVLPFTPRVNEMKLGIDFTTGAITSHKVVGTTLLKDVDGNNLTGLNPQIAAGNVATLGRSFDSEGFHRLPNGNYLIADEYGPSVYEFDANGKKLRAFEVPANLVPKTAGGQVDYVNGRPTIAAGRQDNRGYEGLTVSPDGSKAYAILQDPLVNEGNPDGRRGRFLRIVEFDVASGQSTGQYTYELESLSDINARIPGTNRDFGANAQGRNIGVSSITALSDGSFLVIERDNRGLGVEENSADPDPIGTKRVYRIRLDGATDISGDVLPGGLLPAGAKAVQKELFVDVQAALVAAGLNSVEKLEGLTFGPRLTDGSIAMYIVSDNDFSVTQNGSNVQFDVCAKSGSGSIQVPLGGACPAGYALIPTTIYAFKISGVDAAGLVPEPATWAMMIAGFGLAGAAMRRRRGLTNLRSSRA